MAEDNDRSTSASCSISKRFAANLSALFRLQLEDSTSTYMCPVLIGVDKRMRTHISFNWRTVLWVSNNALCLLLCIAICSSKLSSLHVPAPAQCRCFGGVSSGKLDVWKYFDKSTDGKKAKKRKTNSWLSNCNRKSSSSEYSNIRGKDKFQYSSQS